MVDQRGEPQANLAGNLQPQVKGVARCNPVRQSQLRPISSRDDRRHVKSLL
jgi:hypothetical protein